MTKKHLLHPILCGALLSLSLNTPRLVDAVEKSPIPSSQVASRLLEAAREIYAADLQEADTSAERSAIAKKMIARARKTPDNDAAYAVFELARETAICAGDIDTAMAAVKLLGVRFEADLLALSADTLQAMAKEGDNQDREKCATALLALVEEAVEADRFDVASRAAVSAVDAARRARQSDLLKEAVAHSREVDALRKSHDKFAKTIAILEENPTDPDANLVVGKYYFFSRGDAERGLPYLALGSDPLLKQFATKELLKPSEASERMELADGWWDLAEKADGNAREEQLRRAAYWYRRAVSGLNGLEKVKATKRLAEIAEALASQSKPSQDHRHTAARRPPRGKPVKTGVQTGGVWARLPDGGTGRSIPGVRIVFTSEDKTFVRTVVSGPSGRYWIELPKGRYTVVATARGFQTYDTGTGFFVVTGDGPQTGNIFIKSK